MSVRIWGEGETSIAMERDGERVDIAHAGGSTKISLTSRGIVVAEGIGLRLVVEFKPKRGVWRFGVEPLGDKIPMFRVSVGLTSDGASPILEIGCPDNVDIRVNGARP